MAKGSVIIAGLSALCLGWVSGYAQVVRHHVAPLGTWFPPCARPATPEQMLDLATFMTRFGPTLDFMAPSLAALTILNPRSEFDQRIVGNLMATALAEKASPALFGRLETALRTQAPAKSEVLSLAEDIIGAQEDTMGRASELLHQRVKDISAMVIAGDVDPAALALEARLLSSRFKVFGGITGPMLRKIQRMARGYQIGRPDLSKVVAQQVLENRIPVELYRDEAVLQELDSPVTLAASPGPLLAGLAASLADRAPTMHKEASRRDSPITRDSVLPDGARNPGRPWGIALSKAHPPTRPSTQGTRISSIRSPEPSSSEDGFGRKRPVPLGRAQELLDESVVAIRRALRLKSEGSRTQSALVAAVLEGWNAQYSTENAFAIELANTGPRIPPGWNVHSRVMVRMKGWYLSYGEDPDVQPENLIVEVRRWTIGENGPYVEITHRFVTDLEGNVLAASVTTVKA